MTDWLTQHGLQEYDQVLKNEGFENPASLAGLTQSDLREIGFKMAHAKRLLKVLWSESQNINTLNENTSAAGPSPVEQVMSIADVQVADPQTIFLSYAHRSESEDDFDVSEELVVMIQQELQRYGHKVWIDKDGIRAGSQWRERITAAILQHTHFLSFLSVRSVRDPGVCLNEIATALGASKNIQTVMAQDERCVTPPLTISHIQWHDFQNWSEIRAGVKTGPLGEDWHTWFDQRMKRLRETLTNKRNAVANGELQPT